MSFTLLGILQSQAAGAGAAAYEHIQTLTSNGSTTSFAFTSLPTDYKHIQIRASIKITYTPRLSINNDSGTNYVWESWYGQHFNNWTNQSSVSKSWIQMGESPGNDPGDYVIDIYDYNNANKATSVAITWLGINSDWGGYVAGAHLTNQAMTSVEIYTSLGSFASGDSVAIYGIRG